MEDEVMEGKDGGKSRVILKEKRNLNGWKGMEGWPLFVFIPFHFESFTPLLFFFSHLPHSHSLCLLPCLRPYYFLFHLSSCLLPLWPSWFFSFYFHLSRPLVIEFVLYFPSLPFTVLLYFHSHFFSNFMHQLCVLFFCFVFLHLAFVWPGTFNIEI